MKIKGSCLCGNLSYQIETESGEIYQCHCSRCRKFSGSLSNANIVIPSDKFKWLKPPDTLKSFVTEYDWESVFCETCGSTAPQEVNEESIFYVPAGSLKDADILKVTQHKHLDSKACWDTT